MNFKDLNGEVARRFVGGWLPGILIKFQRGVVEKVKKINYFVIILIFIPIFLFAFTMAAHSVENNGNNQDQEQYANSDSNSNSNSDSNSSSSQAQAANNEGVAQTVYVDSEASRNHIRGPGLLESDAPAARSAFPMMIKTHGSVWERVNMLTYDQATKLGKASTDAVIDVAILFENDFRTARINKGSAGVFMGYIYAYSDGEKISAAGLEGKIARAAMDVGATHMKQVAAGSGEVIEGDAWNIGLGGGASLLSSGNSVAVVPNGGLGIGEADSYSEIRPGFVFELSFDETIIKELK